jgi:hypothetical protein
MEPVPRGEDGAIQIGELGLKPHGFTILSNRDKGAFPAIP